MRKDGSNSGLSTCRLASNTSVTAAAPIARRTAMASILGASRVNTSVFIEHLSLCAFFCVFTRVNYLFGVYLVKGQNASGEFRESPPYLQSWNAPDEKC